VCDALPGNWQEGCHRSRFCVQNPSFTRACWGIFLEMEAAAVTEAEIVGGTGRGSRERRAKTMMMQTSKVNNGRAANILSFAETEECRVQGKWLADAVENNARARH